MTPREGGGAFYLRLTSTSGSGGTRTRTAVRAKDVLYQLELHPQAETTPRTRPGWTVASYIDLGYLLNDAA
jgi:hypothetical protein